MTPLLVVLIPVELAESGSEVQTCAIPLFLRRKGMILSLPIGLLKESLLVHSPAVDEEALIGPSQVFEVSTTF